MEKSIWNAQVGVEHTVQRIDTGDRDMNGFLFSLGCYSGEPITVISRRGRGCVVAIKDARYAIDAQLASKIWV